MEFKEFTKQYLRLCKNYSCGNCPIMNAADNVAIGPMCGNWVFRNPEAAEEVVSEWAEEHPAITNSEKFKQVFGLEIFPDPDGSGMRNWLDEEYQPPEEQEDG